ncbi:hypothetical protein HHI36_011558 [Cryptolaemus montrouzieri]|uniref:Uncharacterized protein n=1 Tax=Cryptolaemus montrouzieri TaxID=559131 RepID=A0ABD2MMY2_9CUCU
MSHHLKITVFLVICSVLLETVICRVLQDDASVKTGFQETRARKDNFGQNGLRRRDLGNGIDDRYDQTSFTQIGFPQSSFGQDQDNGFQQSDHRSGFHDDGEFISVDIRDHAKQFKFGTVDNDSNIGNSNYNGEDIATAVITGISTEPELSEKRIISVRFNCPIGYVSDRRGRCREKF